MTRPRLLFLSHRLPYPPHNGAAIRTYNVLRLLAQDFEITALCFDRQDPATKSFGLTARIEAMRPYGSFEVVPIPQEQNRVRLAWDHLRSVVTGRAYTYYVHDSREFDRRLREQLSTDRFDLVHMDSLDLVRYLPLLGELPVACTHHNVESDLLRRRADVEPRAWRRYYLRLQAALLEAEERRWLGRVALNVAVSEDDARTLARLVPEGRYATLPNGVDTEYFQPGHQPESGIAFVGGTSWFPNKDAIEWFAAEILPELRRLEPEAPIHWIGRATEEEITRLGGYMGLHLTGYVDDIRPLVARAACFIVPLRVGGGTRLKILDAWAMGKAVVSTAVGCEGLAAVDRENILIANDPATFAARVHEVLRDECLRRRLGTAARRTVEERYSWTVVGESMRRLYLSLLKPAPGGDRPKDEAALPK